MRGPRLLALIALAIAAMCATIVVTGNDGLVATSARIVRWTARTSVLMFGLAFVARPAMQLWRSPVTKYLLAERKWIGLGFATSHAAHLGGIIALASPDFGAFLRSQPPTNAIAATTFLLIFAMAFTSIERVKRMIAPRRWKLLHRTGMYFAWVSFTATYATRIADEPVFAIPTALLLGIAGVRIAAWVRARKRAALIDSTC